MARDARVADQDVLVELAPEQLVDPGDGAGVAAVELALVGGQGGMQALAWRQHAGGQVGRQLAGTGAGREVALAIVVAHLFIGEALQALLGRVFACRPQLAQAGAGRAETGDRAGNRVTGDGQWRLRPEWRDAGGQGAVQALVADLAELAVDLEVAAGAGQHAAGPEEQLVEVAVPGDVLLPEVGGDLLVAQALVDAVLLVDVDGADVVLVADLGELGGGVAPVRAVAYQQRHVEPGQRALQLGQVAQPEVHLAWRVVVALPLLRSDQVQGDGRATQHGLAEGGVVLGAQVSAQPHQSLHGVTSCMPSRPWRSSQAWAASGSLADCSSLRASRWM